MATRPLKYINTTLFIILIPLVNLVFFLVYYFAYPELGFWVKLWDYLSSAVFTLITGSLIIPLLLAIIEKRFKFLENIQQDREARRKQVEERRRQNRQNAIKDTIAMWQELYNETSEVVYFNLNDKSAINDLLRRLINLTSTAEHIVNKWTHQFTNLKSEDNDVFLEFINLLYQSSLSVAFYIKYSEDEKEVRLLQEMLYMIQDQVKTIANHSIINTLKYAAKELDMKEGGAGKDEISKVNEALNKELKMLRDWAEAIREISNKRDNFLATATGEHIDEVRKLAKNIEAWLKEDKDRWVTSSDLYPEFEKKFKSIALKERLSSTEIPFSKEYIRELADWLSLQSSILYLYNRAHNIW